MSFIRKTGEWQEKVGQEQRQAPLEDGVQDPVLDRALRDFRASVHAWSEDVYIRTRTLASPSPRRMAWRQAAVWSLGSVLMVGVAGGGLLGYQHRQEQARIAAAREAELQRQIAEERAREAEQELAKIDSAVSREVPNALEPLAQLMTEDESQ